MAKKEQWIVTTISTITTMVVTIMTMVVTITTMVVTMVVMVTTISPYWYRNYNHYFHYYQLSPFITISKNNLNFKNQLCNFSSANLETLLHSLMEQIHDQRWTRIFQDC